MAENEEKAPEEELAPEAPPAEEALAEDAAPADDAPAEEAAEAPAETPAAAEAPAEPEAPLTPKERRHRQRAAKFAAVPTRPQTSPEERQAERDAIRARKAAVRRNRRASEREKARAARAGEATPEPIAARPQAGHGNQKVRQGIVVSDKAAKTIVVRIDVARRHTRYEKIVRTSSTLHVHDEQGDAHIGDTVVVRECRPLSRTKRWRLVEVLERAK